MSPDCGRFFMLRNDLCNSFFRLDDTLARVQQAAIDVKAEVAVIHPGFPLNHSILIGAEIAKALVYKFIERYEIDLGLISVM